MTESDVKVLVLEIDAVWSEMSLKHASSTGEHCQMNVSRKQKRVISLLTIILLACKCALQRSAYRQQEDQQVCLLTTMWNDLHRNVEHLREIKHAIELNVRNPFINFVHVVLDGAERQEACDKLHAEVHHATGIHDKFNCVVHHGSQPTYLEMFQYSQSIRTQNCVVILANADMVFDATVRYAAKVNPDTICTIATKGYGGILKEETLELDEDHTNTSVLMPNRCYTNKEPRSSWDAYIFHPKSIRLQSRDWVDEHTFKQFSMNQLYAENSALHALLKNSKKVRKAYQVCDFVNMWHYHFAPKTYNVTSKWVQHLGYIAGDCPNLKACF